LIKVKKIASSPDKFSSREQFTCIGENKHGKVYQIRDKDKSLWDSKRKIKKPLAVDYLYGRVTYKEFSPVSGYFYNTVTLCTAKSYDLDQRHAPIDASELSGRYAKMSTRPAPMNLCLWDIDGDAEKAEEQRVVLIEMPEKFRGLFVPRNYELGELRLKLSRPLFKENYSWYSHL